MPVLVIPLILNMLISGAIWISEIATTFKVVLTTITVIKFSIFVYSGFFCENKGLKIGGFISCFLLNAFLIVMGIVHNMIGAIIPSALLIVMFFIWVILPRVFVKEEKEGSK